MNQNPQPQLSRRERQIMDIVYRLGQAAAGDVLEGLPDPPSYSAVRGLLRVLEHKGHLTHERIGLRYIYRPTIERDSVRRSALRHIVKTFFDGSISQAMVALLDQSSAKLSDEELGQLAELIEEARRQGR